MSKDSSVRVRFAPSPTGPLHIGGVRTALYNYLFAKKHGGTFILRIEDTDQTRYVQGAEEYILQSLEWLGLAPEESVNHGGDYGPYRQSERKDIYKQHVDQLIASGHAYYAFDTPEELEAMRTREQAAGVHTPKYDQSVRLKMRNSLTLSTEEVATLVEKGDSVTVRMKVPADETVTFKDKIREEVSFNSNELDDKVILKADGLPTYHLANIVDDRSMKISHVIRGEEWLSSTAHHVLLYRSFGWEDEMPVFAHLPLILKPSGKGKLSKRDGAKFGFPVFPLEWFDEKEQETYAGFREEGFLPEALINFLSLLGWNPGNDEEIFSIDDLCQIFSLDQINKSGAQFNYDKAKWFNQQYINSTETSTLYPALRESFDSSVDRGYLEKVIDQLKPRVTFLGDFKKQSAFFFDKPKDIDEKGLRKKFKLENEDHFTSLAALIKESPNDSEAIQIAVKGYIADHELSFGAIFAPLRIFIAGTMAGPDLFEMISLIGNQECSQRIIDGIPLAKQLKNNG